MADVVHKSEKLEAIAKDHGWKAEVEPLMDDFETSGDPNDIVWTLYALRDKESVRISWRGNRQQEPGTYKYGDYIQNLHNPGAAVKIFEGQPDPKKLYKARAERVDNGEDFEDELVAYVPWDKDTPAIDVMKAIMHKEVTYRRKIDGKICSTAVVVNLKEPGSARQFKVYETKSGRQVQWADAEGFHAIALDQIINVS